MSGEVFIEPDIGTTDTSFITPNEVFGTGPGTLSGTLGDIGASISDFFGNLFKTSPTIESPPVSRTITPINPNVIAGSAAIGAASIGSALIFTNKDFNQSVQANAGALQDLSSSFKTVTTAGAGFTDFLTKNPIILIALIGLGAIVVLKK